MAVKISGMMGTGSMGHNNRKFITENVDPARTEQNITLCRENLKQVYHELFDEALAEYNAKKTKTRDKIPDYYRHIEKSKQERLFHEVIFQIGNKDNCGCETPDGERAAAALKEFAEAFQERNPHLRVFNSVIHIQKRLKEAQELSDLKDENMALEYELNRQKDLMARLMQRVEAALNFLEEKLPEQFRPYVQRARAHIMPEPKQKHRNDRGMSMGGMER